MKTSMSSCKPSLGITSTLPLSSRVGVKDNDLKMKITIRGLYHLILRDFEN